MEVAAAYKRGNKWQKTSGWLDDTVCLLYRRYIFLHKRALSLSQSQVHWNHTSTAEHSNLNDSGGGGGNGRRCWWQDTDPTRTSNQQTVTAYLTGQPWKMNKLFVAATAIDFSCGCHAEWSTLRLKSMDSTLSSLACLLPIGLFVTTRCWRGSVAWIASRDASKHSL